MSSKSIIYYYTTPAGDNPVKKFLDSLSEKQQAKILRAFQLIEEYGLQLPLGHIKKLKGTSLWEIRILGKDNIRLLYTVPKRDRILILHGFVKKTQKTPAREINTAIDRYQDWIQRHT